MLQGLPMMLQTSCFDDGGRSSRRWAALIAAMGEGCCSSGGYTAPRALPLIHAGFVVQLQGGGIANNMCSTVDNLTTIIIWSNGLYEYGIFVLDMIVQSVLQ